MLLEVGSVRRRAGCSALAAQGGLTAGSAQWLGVAVAPLSDPLERAQLQLSAFGSPGGAPTMLTSRSRPPFLVPEQCWSDSSVGIAMLQHVSEAQCKAYDILQKTSIGVLQGVACRPCSCRSARRLSWRRCRLAACPALWAMLAPPQHRRQRRQSAAALAPLQPWHPRMQSPLPVVGSRNRSRLS